MTERFVVLLTTAPTLHESTRELASRLAARANAVLLFLHVVPGASHGESMLHAAADLASGAPESWLRRLRPSHAGVPFRHRLELGDPADVAARFVREHHVELLVAEEPPRGWIAETLWRGLAETLIRRVNCPVVIGGPGFLRSEPPATPPIRPMLAEATVAELLNAMVEARVDALRGWMDRTAGSVGRIAAADTVRTVVTLAREDEPIDASLERRLLVELDEHQRALRAIGWRLMTPHHRWGSEALTPVHGLAFAEFVRRVDAVGHSASLPLALDDGLERLVMLAGARVSGGAGGMLLFGFDAEEDFLRILGQPGPLPTFETYAFDSAGLMLSHSRFPEHLLASGLLTTEGQQTPLRLRVAEPSDGPVEGWPLTRMAQAATRHQNGFDTRGYLDYRGARVVGAWRWVPEYGFGVTAEVDHAAAYPAASGEPS
ncbi:MAG: universal stress protein [Acidobacteria bacterium]|nr:universal stress protein [Acidobacteriota bacterium]